MNKISYTISTDIDGPILHFMAPDWKGDDLLLAALIADVAKNMVIKYGYFTKEEMIQHINDLPDYEDEFPDSVKEIANRCFQDLLDKKEE